MANNELLQATLDKIISEPENWDQTSWRCGTSFCFAGHAALLGGWKPVGPGTAPYWQVVGYESEEEALGGYRSGLLSDEEREARKIRYNRIVPNTSPTMVGLDGRRQHIVDIARDLLDLDSDTTDRLFSSVNTLDDLKGMVQEIKENGYL